MQSRLRVVQFWTGVEQHSLDVHEKACLRVVQFWTGVEQAILTHCLHQPHLQVSHELHSNGETIFIDFSLFPGSSGKF